VETAINLPYYGKLLFFTQYWKVIDVSVIMETGLVTELSMAHFLDEDLKR